MTMISKVHVAALICTGLVSEVLCAEELDLICKGKIETEFGVIAPHEMSLKLDSETSELFAFSHSWKELNGPSEESEEFQAQVTETKIVLSWYFGQRTMYEISRIDGKYSGSYREGRNLNDQFYVFAGFCKKKEQMAF